MKIEGKINIITSGPRKGLLHLNRNPRDIIAPPEPLACLCPGCRARAPLETAFLAQTEAAQLEPRLILRRRDYVIFQFSVIFDI